MRLKVLFVNPTGGSAYVRLENVSEWKTDHGELLVFRGKSQVPDVIFAGRQWVWAERIEDKEEEEYGKVPMRPNPIPPRKDHHRVDMEPPAASSVQFNIDGRPVLVTEEYIRAVRDFERAIEEEHGEAAARTLPWNQLK